MKVLILADNLMVGGVNTYCLTLAKGLAELGIDCMLSALGDHECGYMTRRAAAEGLPLTVVPFRMRPVTVGRLSSLIKESGAAILHTQGYRSTVVGRLAVRSERLPVRVVTTIHGITANIAFRVRLYNMIEDLTRGWTDRFIAVSDDTKRRLVAKGFPGNRISVVHNGVHDGGHKAFPGSQGPVLGYVGRLSPEKGVRRLPGLFRMIRKEVSNAQLLIVGDGPERPYLEATFDPQDQQAVSFLGAHDDVGALHPRMRALLLPSMTEGLPLVVLEAMAAGLPVAATMVGGVPETVSNGVTGFLSARDDLDGLAHNAALLLKDAALATKMGIQARRMYERRFTVRQMVDGTVAAYYEVSR